MKRALFWGIYRSLFIKIIAIAISILWNFHGSAAVNISTESHYSEPRGRIDQDFSTTWGGGIAVGHKIRPYWEGRLWLSWSGIKAHNNQTEEKDKFYFFNLTSQVSYDFLGKILSRFDGKTPVGWHATFGIGYNDFIAFNTLEGRRVDRTEILENQAVVLWGSDVSLKYSDFQLAAFGKYMRTLNTFQYALATFGVSLTYYLEGK